MPQGRRKVPFSGKAKKAQLQAKKQQRQPVEGSGERGYVKDIDIFEFTSFVSRDETGIAEGSEVVKLNQQPIVRGRGNPNRYALQFHRETEAEIRKRKEAARKTIVPVSPSGFEIDIDSFFLKDLDFPKRPPWNFDMSRDQLEAREHRYFTEYISDLEKKFNWKDLSYFELNLETWRQLWRVLEMSDIVLIIVDIRFCALMFPPSVYHYVTETLHKDMILVLNKIDLAPASLVTAWKHYFKEKFPALHILTFTSYPKYNLRGNQENKAGLQIRRRRGKLRMAAEGAKTLLETCKSIVNNEVDLSSWHKKISEETELEFDDDETVEIGETVNVKEVDTSYIEHVRYKEGTLTIGCIGQPNVGKSSLMNAVMGKKVVSVSKTPGHTKHFQTIYLTPNVRLCDCPGLVFPSKVPKTLQVLMGSFPIAQLREPYSAIQYLAERLDLPQLLKLQHPEQDDEWSAIDICDGWALKRGFHTARAARLDTFRAANNLLRMALDGKINLCLQPPNYWNNKEYWESHPDVEVIHWIQAKTGEELATAMDDFVSSEEEEESDKNVSERGDQTTEEANRESSSESDDEDSDVAFGSSNKFAVLGGH
ncbi:guanine nucleotide-binding protein-like 1 isoform X1 [Periplaneta americana]|uniref:guanine nucleotide-binding protein-like 1 isoform X1 n=1 Tax=Periplaneta americana TaxID=6978 RepID=UPI0037E83A79